MARTSPKMKRKRRRIRNKRLRHLSRSKKRGKSREFDTASGSTTSSR